MQWESWEDNDMVCYIYIYIYIYILFGGVVWGSEMC